MSGARYYRGDDEYEAARAERRASVVKPDRRELWRQKGYRLKVGDLEAMDVVEFAKYALGVDFGLRPAQELVLRLIYGLELPGGVVRVYLERAGAEGLVLEPRELTWLELYRVVTGNREVWEPGIEKTDTQLVVGRRGGKSHTTAIVTLYEATRRKYRQYLGKGEYGYAVITATRQKQAQDILVATCSRLLSNSKISNLMESEPTKNEIRLTNGMRIAAYPCNSKAALGLPMFFLAFDELAHFMVEGVKADRAVIDALRPGMQQFAAANPKILAISTPAAKQGYFWEEYAKGFRQHDKVLVQAPTWVFNPPCAYNDPEYKSLRAELRKVGPDAFDREYRAQFAEQMSAFLSPEQVAKVSVLAGDVPYNPKYVYFLGIDQSGLSGADRFSAAVAHRDPIVDVVTLDLVKSWDTKDTEELVPQLRDLKHRYSLHSAMIDRYASGWVTAMLRRVPMEVELQPGLPKVWTNMKNLIVAEKLELPDRQTLRTALVRTQAFYSKANTLSIAHERTSDGHGDEADAGAYAIMAASSATWLPTVRGVEAEMMAAATAQAEREYNPLTWELN